MHLHPASAADADLVYRIKHEAYAAHAVAAYGLWDEEFQRQLTEGNLPQTRLMRVGATVIGWIAVEHDPEADEIIDLHVRPAYQNRGYGAAALRRVIAEAEAAQRPLRLRVLTRNPARALYQRLGFAVTGESATHVTMTRADCGSARPAGSSGQGFDVLDAQRDS